jgi:alkanesulfonate monooxygenase SsuD/methylene tetrahydromethanopterin reductase-like flavin-dependent oxidoreductase (luciferase family)
VDDRAVWFGIFPTPTAEDQTDVVRWVRRAEELELDLVAVQDHPYQRRFLDTFALLAHLAGVTERIRLAPAVTHLPLRPPAMLAKTAASIDVLSGGRFELGLGAGGFDQPSRAMGAPARTPAEKVDALEEAIDILRRFWATPERGITYEGEHHRLAGVKAGPPPAHPIGIWLGAYGPRMLALTGARADGWIPSSAFLPPEELAEALARIAAAAAAAGRGPADVRRIYNVSGTITDGSASGWLDGPVEHWVEELSDLALEGGVDAFTFWSDGDHDTQLERWAEVAAAVRAAVTA